MVRKKIERMTVVTLLILFVAVLAWLAFISSQSFCKFTYWAINQDGSETEVKNMSMYSVPLVDANDVRWIWPMYVVRLKVRIKGKEFNMQTIPFILSQNPRVQGRYGNRDVFFLEQKKK